MQQFRRRIVLVDPDPVFSREMAALLRREGFEVITDSDGFEALVTLRGATPNMLITELSLPRLSGFELVSIVKTRFPEVSLIVVSSEYALATLGEEAITDAFLEKGPNLKFELLETVRQLMSESPLRAGKAKCGTTWVPRTMNGYIILTCPECLRSFPTHVLHQMCEQLIEEQCVYCSAKVPFRLSMATPIELASFRERDRAKQLTERSHKITRKSKELVNETKDALSESKKLLEHEPQNRNTRGK
jgi:CheY-like chemotaxis protein